MANNYKVSGKKMTSRYGMSHKQEREAVKDGYMPSAEVSKAECIACVGRNYWNKTQRPARIKKMGMKNLPLYDMDGSYYHAE